MHSIRIRASGIPRISRVDLDLVLEVYVLKSMEARGNKVVSRRLIVILAVINPNPGAWDPVNSMCPLTLQKLCG